MSETVERVRAAVTPAGEEHRPSPGMVTFYRVITPITWLAFVLSTSYYTFMRPHDIGKKGHSIWKQNKLHPTPFTLNVIATSIYWIVIWLLQIPYLFNLFAPANLVVPALILAPYFTVNNLLGLAYVFLWTRGLFWWALLVAVINFLNLTFAYFRFPRAPVLQHIAVLAGPLAFAFVTLFWDGAVAVHADRYAVFPRILANVFIWSWAVYGGFYLVIFQDWAMALALSVLTCSLGVSQFFLAVFALQWIFAFTIMGLLFLAAVVTAFPTATGVSFGRSEQAPADTERAPLLAGGNAV